MTGTGLTTYYGATTTSFFFIVGMNTGAKLLNDGPLSFNVIGAAIVQAGKSGIYLSQIQ